MIASLTGVMAQKSSVDAVIDVHGVGYRVNLSLLALAQLPEVGQPVSLRIRTVVREDALDLFGFLSQTEEELFVLLTSVSQVGPKMAINVMSGLDVGELITALGKGEVVRLTKIRGVGRKTAERLVLELKEKVKLLVFEGQATLGRKRSSPANDLVSALVNLGYKEVQAEAAAQAATENAGQDVGFETQFKEALKILRS